VRSGVVTHWSDLVDNTEELLTFVGVGLVRMNLERCAAASESPSFASHFEGLARGRTDVPRACFDSPLHPRVGPTTLPFAGGGGAVDVRRVLGKYQASRVIPEEVPPQGASSQRGVLCNTTPTPWSDTRLPMPRKFYEPALGFCPPSGEGDEASTQPSSHRTSAPTHETRGPRARDASEPGACSFVAPGEGDCADVQTSCAGGGKRRRLLPGAPGAHDAFVPVPCSCVVAGDGACLDVRTFCVDGAHRCRLVPDATRAHDAFDPVPCSCAVLGEGACVVRTSCHSGGKRRRLLFGGHQQKSVAERQSDGTGGQQLGKHLCCEQGADACCDAGHQERDGVCAVIGCPCGGTGRPLSRLSPGVDLTAEEAAIASPRPPPSSSDHREVAVGRAVKDSTPSAKRLCTAMLSRVLNRGWAGAL